MKLHIIYNHIADLAQWMPLEGFLPEEWNVSYGNHYDEKSLDIASRSDVVLSYTPVVPQLYNFLWMLKRIRPEIKICIHPHEGYYAYETLEEYILGKKSASGSFRTRQDLDYSFVDRFYLWGTLHLSEWAPRLIGSSGLLLDAVRLTGTVYHDYQIPEDTQGDKYILYCSGCMGYGLYSDEDFVSSGDVLGDPSCAATKNDVLKKVRDACIADRRLIYSKIMRAAESRHETKIVVRLHPYEARELREKRGLGIEGIDSLETLLKEMREYPNIIVEDNGNKMTSDDIRYAKMVLHHGSTTSVQSAYYSVPSYMIDLPSLRRVHETVPSEFSQMPHKCPGETLIAPDAILRVINNNIDNAVSIESQSFETKKRFAYALYLPSNSGMGKMSDSRYKYFAQRNLANDLKTLSGRNRSIGRGMRVVFRNCISKENWTYVKMFIGLRLKSLKRRHF